MKPSFYSRYRFGIFACFLFVTPIIVSSSQHALQKSYTRVEDWLPEAFEETKQLNWFQEHFVSDDLLIISWEGCTFDDQRLSQLADKLRQPVDIGDQQQVELARQIITGPEVLESLREEPLDLTRREALVRLRGWLTGDDLQTTCLLIMVSSAGWEHRHFLVDHIYATAAATEGLDPQSLHVAGTTMDSVAIDQASQDGLQLMLFGSYAVSCLLMALMFRSIVLTTAVFLTAVFCQQMSLAVVEFSGGHIDSVMLMIPSLIYVLSISASVHLVNYYRDAVELHGFKPAPILAVQYALLPCSLASLTTALGLGSLGVSFLTPVRNFGIYSAVSVILATVVVFVLLPALLSQFMPRANLKGQAKPDTEQSDKWRSFCEGIDRRSTTIVWASMILLAASIWGLTQIRTSARIHDLFPKDAKILNEYDWFEDKIGPLVPLEVVLVMPKQMPASVSFLDRMRVVGAVHAAISAHEGIGAVISALNMSPQIKRRSRRTQDVIKEALINKQLENNWSTFIELNRLRQTPTEQLWRLSARAYAGKGLNYATLLEELKKTVEPILVRSASLGMGNVRAVYCGGVPLVQKAQEQMLKDLIHSFMLAFLLISVMMIGLALWGSAKEISALADRRLMAKCVGSKVLAGLIIMISNVLPCVAVLGGMGLMGIKLEIGSIMTASVALGIAVDDTLHFITWFRRGTQRGMSRSEAVQYAYKWCANAMIQTSLICGLGLLMFAFSEFVPISRFAWVMFSMVMFALVADLVVLPAILLSPLGKVFEPMQSDSPQG